MRDHLVKRNFPGAGTTYGVDVREKVQSQRVIDLEAENRQLRARLETFRYLASLPAHTHKFEEGQKASKHPAGAPAEYTFDAERDTSRSHIHPAFGSVLHLFHSEYFGIRAAAGNLPGGKLAITAEKPLSGFTIADIIQTIESKGYNRFVLHGYSANLDVLARRIARIFGARIFCVWHGNFAQLAYREERAAFQRWLRLQEEGLVARAHILKRSASDFLERGFRSLLLNVPPNWNGKRIAPPFHIPEVSTAFLPSWPDIRKNWHANMLAAGRTSAVRKILFYADETPLFAVGKPTEKINFDVKDHLEVVSSVDIIFNATLIDCHPMVDLEGLACGTPSITAQLFLDGLDRHPYARLTSVDNPLDIDAIVRSASKVAEVPSVELAEMMADYSISLLRSSLSRYQEFIEL